MTDIDTAAEQRMRNHNREQERRMERGRRPPPPLVAAREALPDNWHLGEPKITRKGSEYMVLLGEIEGKYNKRTPSLVLFKPPDGSLWSVKPGRHFIDPEDDTLFEGEFRDALDAVVDLAERQNSRWTAIDGFVLP